MAKNLYPMPQHEDLIDYLGSLKFFISLDICSGYWQYCIAKEDIPKIAFVTWYGLYEWIVILRGLMNAPAVFSNTQ